MSAAPNHVSRVGEYGRAERLNGEEGSSPRCEPPRGDTHAGRLSELRRREEGDGDTAGASAAHAEGDVGELGDGGSSERSSRRRMRSAYSACASPGSRSRGGERPLRRLGLVGVRCSASSSAARPA